MRLTFFFSTVAFCYFAAIALFAVSETGSRRPFPTAGRASGRSLERMLCAFSALLAFWSLGTAFFVSSDSESEALLWFRLFAFSWYLAPGTFVLFAYAQASRKPRLPFAALPFVPGLAVVAVHLIDPSSVVAAAPAVSGGRHVVYASTFWSHLAIANTVLMPLIAAGRLAGTALSPASGPRRRQAGVVLLFFAPTYLFTTASSVVARWFGVSDLPPMAPAFSVFLVFGLSFAVFRLGLLDLTPVTAAKRIWSSVSDGVALVSAEGAVIDSNLPGGARGGRLDAFVEGASAGAGNWAAARAEGESAGEESLFAFEPGKFLPASLRVRAVNDDRGPIGFVVAARDLSAEKSLARETALSSERESALRSAEDNFARVFRLSPAGMIIAELGTSAILDANAAAARVAGLTREDLIGRDLWSLDISVSQGLLDDMRRTLTGGLTVDTREISVSRERGAPLVFAMTAGPIDFSGRKAALISFVDISELIFLRRELFKSQKNESIGAMAAGLAHDFNNILTAIMGNVSLARLSVDEAGDVSAALASAEAACSRARDLSKQLVIYASGGVTVPEPHDVFEVAREATRIALSGSSATASFESEANLPRALVDRARLAMAFNNLALNAVNSMPAGGALRVRGSLCRVDERDASGQVPGEYVRVEFADEGEGLEPEQLNRIFDPYVNTKKKLGGFGLAICDSIVQRLGGWISVESVRGKGSTFAVYLPALAPAGAEPRREEVGAERGVKMGRGKILLMDDDLAIRTMSARLLTRLGYEATTVADGPAAAAAFKAAQSAGTPFRAAILDLTIAGGIGGVETAGLLRELDATVPIFVSSGYGNGPVLDDYPSYGFDGTIPKPYTLEELSFRLSGVR